MKTLVVRTWNGKSPPHDLMYIDAVPAFDLMTFDYSGASDIRSTPFSWPGEHRYFSHRTECKGQIYLETFRAIGGDLYQTYDYIGLVDDDVILSVSALNQLLFLAQAHELDSFAPSLSHDSIYSHDWTLQHPGTMLRNVSWVEIMMPFYRSDIFLAASPFYEHTISGYGLDCFVMPIVCKALNMERVAVIDAVAAKHAKPITSNSRVYSNGLTAPQELELMRHLCVTLMNDQERRSLLQVTLDRQPWRQGKTLSCS